MPRPTARATAPLRLRTSSSSRATAPPPIRNSRLTSSECSAEHENLAHRGGCLSSLICIFATSSNWIDRNTEHDEIQEEPAAYPPLCPLCKAIFASVS